MKKVLNIIGSVFLMVLISTAVNAQVEMEHELQPSEPNKKVTSSDDVDCIGCEIQKFQITAADASTGGVKNLKVVAGKEFDYQAKNIEAHVINWELGTAPTWDITAVTPASWDFNALLKTSKGVGLVDGTIMPTDHSKFGGTNGTAKIEDFIFGFDLCLENVEVFFSKDEMNVNEPTEPNWFYYWSQFITTASTGTTVEFDSSLGGYASTNPSTRVVSVSQLASEYNDETTHNGIHTYYETIEHENHHMVLWDAWWPLPTGYDASLDLDGDFYPDLWEDNDPIAIMWMFASGDPSDDYGNATGSGYLYEEYACRQVEHMLTETIHDTSDWSFDLNGGANQGKQWK